MFLRIANIGSCPIKNTERQWNFYSVNTKVCPFHNQETKKREARLLVVVSQNFLTKKEFADGKQRAAVCYNIFKEAKSEASVAVSVGGEEILYFSDSAKKKKMKSYGSPEVGDHYFETKEEAMKDAEKMGLKGIHTHKTEDGETLYMAGPSHEAFMKRHKEIIKNK